MYVNSQRHKDFKPLDESYCFPNISPNVNPHHIFCKLAPNFDYNPFSGLITFLNSQVVIEFSISIPTFEFGRRDVILSCECPVNDPNVACECPLPMFIVKEPFPPFNSKQKE